jgi:hypothetical protein
MVIEHAEQTNNCNAATKCNVSQGKHLKVETTKIRYYAIIICTDAKTMECQFCARSLNSTNSRNLSSPFCTKLPSHLEAMSKKCQYTSICCPIKGSMM